MIERYSREEIKKIWDINSKFQYYLNVELAVCEAYCDLGEISKDVSEFTKDGLVNLYACDESNNEGNGFFEKMTINRPSTNVSNDTIGPEILKLFVNSPDFENNSIVGSTPYFYVVLIFLKQICFLHLFLMQMPTYCGTCILFFDCSIILRA